MNDQLLEKIKNHVLNNMGNKEFMHLISYLETRQDFYTQNSDLKALVMELVEALGFYENQESWVKNNFIWDRINNTDLCDYRFGNVGCKINGCGGKRARSVLSKNKELIEAIKDNNENDSN